MNYFTIFVLSLFLLLYAWAAFANERHCHHSNHHHSHIPFHHAHFYQHHFRHQQYHHRWHHRMDGSLKVTNPNKPTCPVASKYCHHT